jgi:hypothetical protein
LRLLLLLLLGLLTLACSRGNHATAAAELMPRPRNEAARAVQELSDALVRG